MKRFISLFLCLVVLVCVAADAQGQRIRVLVNGQPVAFDQPPVMMGGRVLVPLRGVFEQMGATVVFLPSTRSINAQRGQTQISLQVGSTAATINGTPRQLDTPPILVGGRAEVPLRFLSEALGARVRWDPTQYLVRVDSEAAIAPPPPPPPAELIQAVEVNTRGPVPAGRPIGITLIGAPGGLATYDIGPVRAQPMVEGPPGTYRATYVVRPYDHDPHALVRGHLRMPDGRHSARNAAPVALGFGPPINPYNVIYSVQSNAQGPVFAGQVLEVTMTGRPGGFASFDVGYARNIPMREMGPGTYVGSYAVPPGPNSPNTRVEGHLRMPDGRRQTMRARNVQIVGR